MLQPLPERPNYKGQERNVDYFFQQICNRIRDFKGNRIPGTEELIRSKIAEIAGTNNVSEVVAAQELFNACIRHGGKIPIGNVAILVLWANDALKPFKSIEPSVEDKCVRGE